MQVIFLWKGSHLKAISLPVRIKDLKIILCSVLMSLYMHTIMMLTNCVLDNCAAVNHMHSDLKLPNGLDVHALVIKIY